MFYPMNVPPELIKKMTLIKKFGKNLRSSNSKVESKATKDILNLKEKLKIK